MAGVNPHDTAFSGTFPAPYDSSNTNLNRIISTPSLPRVVLASPPR